MEDSGRAITIVSTSEVPQGGESQSTTMTTSATEPVMTSRVFDLGRESGLSEGGLTGAPRVTIQGPIFMQSLEQQTRPWTLLLEYQPPY